MRPAEHVAGILDFSAGTSGTDAEEEAICRKEWRRGGKSKSGIRMAKDRIPEAWEKV